MCSINGVGEIQLLNVCTFRTIIVFLDMDFNMVLNSRRVIIHYVMKYRLLLKRTLVLQIYIYSSFNFSPKSVYFVFFHKVPV